MGNEEIGRRGRFGIMGDGDGGKRWLREKVLVLGGEIEVGGGVK